jgi:pimeloyl-ACP methyl ester carboxylesterase
MSIIISVILIGLIACCPLLVNSSNQPSTNIQKWQEIPPTPKLPSSNHSGYVNSNGVKVWYAEFGKGSTVILLHGGLTNSNYWGEIIPELAKKHRVIVMDSRGHGRSSTDMQPLTYHLMAKDVLNLMDFLDIKNTSIIGWSDGANIGLDLAINNPKRLKRLFAFAANSLPEATVDVSNSLTFKAFTNRVKKEYIELSPTPSLQNYNLLNSQVIKMWQTSPTFTTKDLQSITVNTWIVAGDHDEAIKRTNTEYMAKTIPHAGLLILPRVGHFGFLQDSEQFVINVQHFLD